MNFYCVCDVCSDVCMYSCTCALLDGCLQVRMAHKKLEIHDKQRRNGFRTKAFKLKKLGLVEAQESIESLTGNSNSNKNTPLIISAILISRLHSGAALSLFILPTPLLACRSVTLAVESQSR